MATGGPSKQLDEDRFLDFQSNLDFKNPMNLDVSEIQSVNESRMQGNEFELNTRTDFLKHVNKEPLSRKSYFILRFELVIAVLKKTG